uniref:Uncharacterized protein n=1 Tax=Arundo donax TaxID=35708 RepID=A0A0A8XU03_ARUDO
MDTFRNRGACRSGSSDTNGALAISFFAYISSSSAAVDQSGACFGLIGRTDLPCMSFSLLTSGLLVGEPLEMGSWRKGVGSFSEFPFITGCSGSSIEPSSKFSAGEGEGTKNTEGAGAILDGRSVSRSEGSGVSAGDGEVEASAKLPTAGASASSRGPPRRGPTR